VARQAGEEGIVLLKNNGILPLDPRKLATIAVVGPNVDPAVTGGGGSSLVQPFRPVSVLQGMRSLAGEWAKVVHATGVQLPQEVFTETRLTVDPEGRQPGASAEYFNNMEMKGEPALRRVDAHVYFDWGEGSYADGQPVDFFSARWIAYFTPETSGTYTFDIQGDDGFRLFVDDKPLIEQWRYLGETVVQASMSIEAGRHYKIRIEYFEGTGQAKIGFGISSNSRVPLQKAVAAAKSADAVVLCVGFDRTSEGEGSDRPFALPEAQLELIRRVLEANRNVIVVLNAGGNLDMSPFLENAAAVLHAWYPGEEGGTAVAEILTGAVNPSGKLPASFERRWEDSPVHDSYYDVNNSRHVRYSEGIFVGYRHYDRSPVKPLFPFGFGLSYTTFTYSGLKLVAEGDHAVVRFTLTNTGTRAGAEVAQVYVGERHPKVPRPVKELKGFARVALQPGESREVTVELDRRAFSYYDESSADWKLQPGRFDISVGGSSQAIALHGTLRAE
jgi:beta-glucosidase